MGLKSKIGLCIAGGICLIGLLLWAFLLPTGEPQIEQTDAEGGKTAVSQGAVIEDSGWQDISSVTEGAVSEAAVSKDTDKKKTGKTSGDKAKSSEEPKQSTSSAGKKNSGTKTKTSKKTSKKGKTTKKTTSSKQTGATQTEQETGQLSTTNSIHKTVVSDLTITSGEAACEVSGSVATIRKAGTYTLTGTISDGQIIVDTEKTSKVTLVCNGMSLNCSKSAPLYIKSADKVTLELVSGTKNSITDGKTYTFATAIKEPDAALYSEDDLTICGGGTLIVKGQYQDGIASKNDIKIEQGSVQVSAADDGIRGKDGIEISGGSVNVVCESHALKTTETLDSQKGMIKISGGKVNLDAVGDGIHATNQIQVIGGSTYIDAKNDGIDTDSSFLMSGGSLTIDGPKSENHAIFACTKGTTVNGGTLFAVGSSAMAKEMGSSSRQKSLFYKYSQEQAADTTVKLLNSSDKVLFQHKTTRKYQCVVYSAPDLSSGTYSVYCNSTRIAECRVD